MNDVESSRTQQIHRGDDLTAIPSGLIHVLPAFHGRSVPFQKRVEALRPYAMWESSPSPPRNRRRPALNQPQRISVSLHRRSFRAPARGEGKSRETGRMHLRGVQAEGSIDQLETKCLEALAELDTDCLLTVFALISMAVDNGGIVADDIREIARRRGWQPSALDSRSRYGAATRRERLSRHLELLVQVEFVITGLGRRSNHYVAFPLLRYLARGGEGLADRPDQECHAYEFHPLLWSDMTKRGRALFFDRALISANAKCDDWPVRLIWYMNSRWGPSWVRRRLDQHGGRITERLGVLLVGAGIEYQSQLKAQGRPWLRETFRRTMDRLSDWQPASLIGGYDIEEAEQHPLEDKVTFWPTAEVSARYTAARSKAIAQRDRIRSKALPQRRDPRSKRHG